MTFEILSLALGAHLTCLFTYFLIIQSFNDNNHNNPLWLGLVYKCTDPLP